LLSLALLGGFTLSPSASVAPTTLSTPAHTWMQLQDGVLCRFWSERDPSTLLHLTPSLNGQSGTTGSAFSPGSSFHAPMTVALKQSVSPTRTFPGSLLTFDTMGMTSLATSGELAHCTRDWHVDTQINLVSDDAQWVSNPDGAWPTQNASDSFSLLRSDALLALHAHHKPAASAPTVPKRMPRPQTQPRSAPTASSPAGGTSKPPSGTPGAWTPVPGHPSYSMSDFAGDPWSQYFGVCTWYAWYRHQNEPLMRLGNAAQWPSTAPSHGLRVGSTPAVGATVVFQPGVEGAGGGGHAAHVEAVLGGGWFIISEMNFYWNNGGWGRVDWRYAYVAPGVSFIY
jgi:surface antigen